MGKVLDTTLEFEAATHGRSSWRSFVPQGALLLGLWALFAVNAFDAHRQARDSAVTALGNLSAALALDLSHKIEMLDRSMQMAGSTWSNDEIRALRPALRTLAVFDGSLSLSAFGPVRIVDPFGAVQAASNTGTVVPGNVADDPAFLAQRDRADAGLFVGPPFTDAAGGELPLSRRLLGADGAFAGAVLGTLKLSVVQASYHRIRLDDGVISLVSDSGQLISREPPPPAAMMKAAIHISLSYVQRGTQEGWFTDVSNIDGREKLFAYHRVGDLPLVQFAALPVADIFADWWRRTLVMTALLAILSGGTVLLQHRLRRELRSREAAERRLQELVLLDPLTGIANRRAFDAAIEREWRAGERRGWAVGLLMIDIDHFKAYNDHYGHLAGDRALVAIAVALDAVAARHGALATRYGGEEFALLLPAIEQLSVLTVARDLVADIARLEIVSAVSAAGHITVSVGAATLVPPSGGSSKSLVAAADEQLYRAKAAGRSQVSFEGRDRAGRSLAA